MMFHVKHAGTRDGDDSRETFLGSPPESMIHVKHSGLAATEDFDSAIGGP